MARYSKVHINGNNYYRVQITCPDGNRKSLYGKTIADIKEKERQFLEEMKAQTDCDCPTVAEYAATQLTFMKSQVQHATYVGYEAKVRLYIAAAPLGEKKLAEVTTDDIKNALLRVTPQSTSCYHTVHMLLCRIFRSAKQNRLIQYDPTEGISSRGGTAKKDRPALSDEQSHTLLNSISGIPVETFCQLGLGAGLRREEALGLKWDCVHLDVEYPYIEVRRAWRIEHNRPVVTDTLKTSAAKRDIPLPPALAEHLRQVKAASTSDYVICNSAGAPLSGTQWRNYWKKVTVRTTSERTYVRYINGQKETHTVTPQLGTRAAHNPDVTYSMDFSVTPHQLRHTYITNLIHAGVDPKTVQYLAGHENSKITMDIYAKVKYNRPESLAATINAAFSRDQDETGSKKKS